MLMLLSLIVYVVLGLPFVAWLAHRLARVNDAHSTTSEVRNTLPAAPEVAAG